MRAEITPVSKTRISSIDILRGLVMVIMAIDHTRDYIHFGHPDPTDLAVTTPFLFFTRYITHFCAPAFIFLSGISAYLAGTRRSKSELSAFLIKRGFWLLVVEVVLITFAGTLDPGFHIIVLQVISAIGVSMILLGLLVWAPLPVIGTIGAIIFFGHNLIDVVNVGTIGKTLWWNLLIASNGFNCIWPIGPGRVIIAAYALLPWTGVMLMGYVFGSIYQTTFPGARRKRILVISGLSLLLMFFVLRAFNLYGDPAPWAVQKTTTLTVISFFNVSKYPCSLIYLAMALGASILVLAFTEHAKNKVANFLMVYGNVPFFYYICHWYLIRILNTITFLMQGFRLKQLPGFDPPAAYGYSLAIVYLIWLMVVLLLYYPCRWYGRYKMQHKHWWLSYL
jgi:uncharacterized membrane protein